MKGLFLQGGKMSRVINKMDLCVCRNKDADQLCSNCTADQHPCFRYTDSLSLLLKPQISSFKGQF